MKKKTIVKRKKLAKIVSTNKKNPEQWYINKFEQIEYLLLMFILLSLNRQIFIYKNLMFNY